MYMHLGFCKRVFPRVFLVLTAIVCLSTAGDAAGKYVLAYWREIGTTENGLRHNVFLHVFDENGNPKSGVAIKSPGGTTFGTTNSEGYIDLPIYTGGGYQMLCSDASGSTSEVTPMMTTRRWPHWGHYSYECAFLYKSDANNTGSFDTSLIGTLNTEESHDNDAPCTVSLAYYNLNPLNADSDAGISHVGSSTHYGQTFRANGNRVVACKILGNAGGVYQYTAQILEGGPNGSQVGSSKTIYPIWSGEYNKTLLAWPKDAVPVVSGQTYYLKITRSGGGTMSVMRGANNYPHGNFYNGGTSIPNDDIFGLVVCGNFGEPIVVSNVQAQDITTTSARITWTTNFPSTSRVDYGTTTGYGQNVYDSAPVTSHTVNLTGLTPDTLYHFKVTSTASGKVDGVHSGSTFHTDVPPSISISEVKSLPNGSIVTLTGKTVTAGNAQFASVFYIEERDRSAGIKVSASAVSVSQGDAVNVTGTVSTSAGERLITNPTVTVRTPVYAVPRPLSMLSRDLGGKSPNAYTPDVTGAVGMHNTGLLVQVWGRVTYVDTIGKFFYINDGCGLSEGSGVVGLRVAASGLAAGSSIDLPAEGSFVKVTGISAVRPSGTNLWPVLRLRTQSDLFVY